MRTFFNSLLLSFACCVFYGTTSSPAFAENCKACVSKYRGACSNNCTNQDTAAELDVCVGTCVSKVCASSCTKEELQDAVPPSDPEVRCKSCIKRAEAKPCLTECDSDSPRYAICVKKCAKTKCAADCDLPLASEGEQIRGKYDCQKCRDRAQTTCNKETWCDPGPGNLTCRLACVQKMCQTTCDQ